MRPSAFCPLRTLAACLLLAYVAAVPLPALAAAEGLRLFGDSPGAIQWDASWGYANAPSWVALAGGSHFPVDTTRAFIGRNALRLTWISGAGGDWMLAAATAAWAPVDPSAMDTLLLAVWAPVAVTAADLPDLLLEDAANVRTARQHLGTFVAGVPAGAWTRVAVPLAAFRAASGGANLANVNKLFFAQAGTNAAGGAHQLAIDEIRFVPAGGAAPGTPQPTARAFERHAEVRWDPWSLPGIETVRVERLDGAAWTLLGDVRRDDGTFVDWRGAPGLASTYRATVLDWHFAAATSAPLSVTTAGMTDAQWLDMTEEAAFRYFWLHAHPTSGLARERYGSGEQCATGGTGMGLMALVAGAQRGYVERAEAAARTLGILLYYDTLPTSYHGAFAHWLNGTTGATLAADTPDDPAGDIVETSYLAQGMLAVRRYYDGPDPVETQVRALATRLWEGIDWNAFRPAVPGDAVDWLWSPTTGFAHSFPVSGWNECQIVYLLATASPTHPVPASCYTTGWSRYGAMRNGNSYYGHTLWVGTANGGPMFFAHYSFLGFDPRNRRDTYADYFLQNRNQALVQSDYSAANPGGRAGYSADVWGLTASDGPTGYAVHAPYSGDDGTLAPTAALASMPYTPDESLRALKAMYRQYGAGLWGPFGFRDAFNPGLGWYDTDYIAIDQGPIVVMIENARSGLLWNCFMANPEIAPALAALGFVADPVLDAGRPGTPPAGLVLAAPAPNPARGGVRIDYALPAAGEVRLAVYDLAGRELAVLAQGEQAAGPHQAQWTAGAVPRGGLCFVRLHFGGRTLARKLVVVP